MADTSPKNKKTGFTLIELLIVVGIIAVLIAILIAALSRALEQARITKCMANQRTLSQGVQMFANDHEGYGQAIANERASRWYGYRPNRYAYEVWPQSLSKFVTGLSLSPWPIAYGPYIGAPGLRSENYFVPGAMEGDPRLLELLSQKTNVPVLRCPSDPFAVGPLSYPDGVMGVLSYMTNQDIFGLIGPWETPSRWVWRDGAPQGESLKGRLDRVVRPSSVLEFLDAGNFVQDGTIRGGWFNSGLSPTLSTYSARISNRPGQGHPLPLQRHSKDGGLVGAYVDGHAQYFRPVRWEMRNVLSHPPGRRSSYTTRQRVPVKFSPDVRITPYEPGAIGPPDRRQR